jgi:sodium-coupled monocarboxylate transporter 8/12
MNHFTLLDYAIFALYLGATVAIGLHVSKGQNSLREYFLAGRNVNRYIVAITVIAALFSGISYLAGPAEVYQNGIGFSLTLFSFFIATPLTTLLVLPKICNSRYLTAYHYFEERFSRPLRLMASGLFLVRVSLWLAAATYAPALALQKVTGMPLEFTILCTGLLSTLYTMKGGMRAVIWTDVMQLGVLFGGQILIVLIAVGKIPGGFEGVWKTAVEDHRFEISLSWDPRERITLWSVLIGGAFLHLVQMATDQVSVQRYLTAGSLREAQRSLWIKLWMFVPVLGIFYGTGLVLYAFYKQHGDPLALRLIERADQILPHFVVTQLPQGLPGILLAAIFAASMSTISAGVNSLTSATISDFYLTLRPEAAAREEDLVRRAKHWTLAYGLLVTGLAFAISRMRSNLVESVNMIIGLVGGPMLGLLALGVLVPRADTRGAVTGTLAGFVVLLGLFFYRVAPAPNAAPAPVVSFLWFTMIGTLITVSVGWLVSRSPASSTVPRTG